MTKTIKMKNGQHFPNLNPGRKNSARTPRCESEVREGRSGIYTQNGVRSASSLSSSPSPGKFHGRGAWGGSVPKGETWPKTQSIRPKIPNNSSGTKIAQKRLTKENVISSIFLDFPRSFLDLPRSFLDLSSIFPRSFLDLPRSSSISSRSLDFPRSSSIFLDLPSIFLGLEIRTVGVEGGDHCVRPTAKFGTVTIITIIFAITSWTRERNGDLCGHTRIYHAKLFPKQLSTKRQKIDHMISLIQANRKQTGSEKNIYLGKKRQTQIQKKNKTPEATNKNSITSQENKSL